MRQETDVVFCLYFLKDLHDLFLHAQVPLKKTEVVPTFSVISLVCLITKFQYIIQLNR